MNPFSKIYATATPAPFKVELTNASTASSYRLPVLRCWVNGELAGDFGPQDRLPNGELAGQYVANPPFPLFDYASASAFCRQWPAGPQPELNEDRLP